MSTDTKEVCIDYNTVDNSISFPRDPILVEKVTEKWLWSEANVTGHTYDEKKYVHVRKQNDSVETGYTW